MLARLKTFSLLGIDAVAVEVEVDVSPRAMPKTILVGLPEAAVRESTHRVERALVNSGYQRPRDRVVINLAPAELPKQASSFDLPISLGILVASGQVESTRLGEFALVGELSLEGIAARAGRAFDGHRRRPRSHAPRGDRPPRKRSGGGGGGSPATSFPSTTSARRWPFSPERSRSNRRRRG